MVGYDGGRVAAEGLADVAIVTRSEHIPRIQEAQASAWHVVRELVERATP
jgi:D-sedoheptulose 7-phosphate isomerase